MLSLTLWVSLLQKSTQKYIGCNHTIIFIIMWYNQCQLVLLEFLNVQSFLKSLIFIVQSFKLILFFDLVSCQTRISRNDSIWAWIDLCHCFPFYINSPFVDFSIVADQGSSATTWSSTWWLSTIQVHCYISTLYLDWFISPEQRSGISDVSPLSGISGLSLIPLFCISSLVLLPSPAAISVLSFSAVGPFSRPHFS